MKVFLEFSNEVVVPIEESFLRRIVERSLEQGGSFLSGKEVALEVVFVNRERIRELNREYRRKDAETDVLSFGNYADRVALRRESSEAVFLGQVFVCYDYVVDASKEDEVTLERELAYIVSHGVLHLLGYDHEEEMFAIQDEISRKY